ncbi:hypothetical protein D9M69_431730 [compost metagenome]
MQCLHPCQMLTQRLVQPLRQQRDPVLHPLAVPHQYFAPGKIHVLHPQPQHLQQTHASAIQKPDNQGHLPGKLRQQQLRFLAAQHQRQTRRPLGTHHVVQPRQFNVQHTLVKKQNRRKRLILRGSGNFSIHRQMRKKPLYLRRSHFRRMTQAMKADEIPHPLHIDILSTDRIMSNADLLTQLIQ